jgi:hypothetical protein
LHRGLWCKMFLPLRTLYSHSLKLEKSFVYFINLKYIQNVENVQTAYVLYSNILPVETWYIFMTKKKICIWRVLHMMIKMSIEHPNILKAYIQKTNTHTIHVFISDRVQEQTIPIVHFRYGVLEIKFQNLGKTTEMCYTQKHL